MIDFDFKSIVDLNSTFVYEQFQFDSKLTFWNLWTTFCLLQSVLGKVDFLLIVGQLPVKFKID